MSQKEQFQSAVEHKDEVSKAVLNHKPRAIIYCRVSTERQEEDGESLDYQEEKCKLYAELHGYEVILVLKEAKSGFIHYSLREKLTLARQFIKDGLADIIIVWDLRRFSRNFVHSAMIFEEIEQAGGQIISVSENIDNSLTGKLIRSILAWSAESERHKIVEYANRRWQSRIELGLPVGVGRPPYGWQWADKEKTTYILDKEKAAIRLTILHMLVELDMSLRGIVNKLSEDRIPTPTWDERSHEEGERPLWSISTVRRLILDPENIGTLVICRHQQVFSPNGKRSNKTHPHRREIPNAMPPICTPELYERALRKMATHQKALSHLPEDQQEFLVRGHVYCGLCGQKMAPRTNVTHRGTVTKIYKCPRHDNKFEACIGPTIRTEPLGEIVWEECCLLFERLETLQQTIEGEMRQALSNMLEDTTGQEQVIHMKEEIEYAKKQRSLYEEGSYMYGLIEQDIQVKKEKLARFQEEMGSVGSLAHATKVYQNRILGFLDFLNTMRGRYHKASFQEKRNALEVLGVKITVYNPVDIENLDEERDGDWENEPEWFTGRQASIKLNVTHKTIYRYINVGQLKATRIETPYPTYMIHRDELRKLHLVAKEFNSKKMVKKRIEISYKPLIFLPTGEPVPSPRFNTFQYQPGPRPS